MKMHGLYSKANDRICRLWRRYPKKFLYYGSTLRNQESDTSADSQRLYNIIAILNEIG